MKLAKAVVLFACLSVGAAAAANGSLRVQPKIVGGEPARSGEFPFIASLQAEGFGHFCGGSLIQKHWVLTAGHCIDPQLTIDKVVIGFLDQDDTSNAEVFTVKRTVQHPQFSGSTMDYDFTLLELDHDSKLTPVQLNRTSINIPGGSNIVSTAAGWGVTNEGSQHISNELMKVDVPLVAADVCDKSYPGRITDRMICAGEEGGRKDSCQGDSGGPLIVNQNGTQTLIGTVSWGQGCGRPNLYGVYGNVASVIGWIDETTAD